MNTRTGKNKWIHEKSLVILDQPDRPDGDGWWANYPPERVEGTRFKYYIGSSDWIKDANQQMAEHARMNALKKDVLMKEWIEDHKNNLIELKKATEETDGVTGMGMLKWWGWIKNLRKAGILQCNEIISPGIMKYIRENVPFELR